MGAACASWKSTAGFSIWARERAHPRVVPAEFGACTSAIHSVRLIDRSNALVDSSAMSQAELGTCDGAAALARVLELARRPNDVPVHSCGCEERLLESESSPATQTTCLAVSVSPARAGLFSSLG